MTNSRILVIDDEEPIAISVKMALRKNHDIATATSAETAFQYLSENKVDLVLLDIKMPRMDGIEVLEEIKKRHADVEVIMMTAYASKENVQKAETLGARGFIFKPFDVTDLRKCIERVLSQKNEGSRTAP